MFHNLENVEANGLTFLKELHHKTLSEDSDEEHKKDIPCEGTTTTPWQVVRSSLDMATPEEASNSIVISSKKELFGDNISV